MEPRKTAALARHIARRAAEEHPGVGVDELLADALAGNDLTTLLLHALAVRAKRRGMRDVFDHAERARLLQASTADARRLHAIDGAIFAAAAAFEAVDLAPVVPLGAATCMGIDPNNVLGTLRFAEVAADPAAGLALWAARARRQRAETLRACASQRVVRMQPLPPDKPHMSPHFRLAALATAARAPRRAEDEAVEDGAIAEQLEAWIDTFERLRGLGFAIAESWVVVADTQVVRACLAVGDEMPRDVVDYPAAVAAVGAPREVVARAERLTKQVGARLAGRGVRIGYDLGRKQALDYYAGPFVQIWLRHTEGGEFAIGDGGALPWLARMLSDDRQRLVVTGIGIELLAKLF